MNRYQEEYNRKKMSARQVLENIQSRDFVFTPMAASCPDALMGELQHLKDTGVKDVILQSCIPSVDYRHTVAQRFISGAVRSIRDVRPAIRKALQTLTLQRSQAANEIGIGFCLLANEIGGVLVLAGALRADHTILTEIIHTLATVDRMMI